MVTPAGVLAAAGLVGGGLALGISAPFIAGAAAVGFVVSAVLHLRDPKLQAAMVAPEFDRDLSRLDSSHRPLMIQGLEARDRLEAAIHEFQGGENEGLIARVTETLRKIYDSVLWLQRVDRFLASVDQRQLLERLRNLPAGPVREEVEAQAQEVGNIQGRREDVLSRIIATTTGIDTLAVKAHSLALTTSDPDQTIDEVRQLRAELNAYAEGLEEIEEHLQQAVPEIGA
ncbi:MAG: hypothetical protein ACR2ME_10865 [Acidimicrobiia bacterium]